MSGRALGSDERCEFAPPPFLTAAGLSRGAEGPVRHVPLCATRHLHVLRNPTDVVAITLEFISLAGLEGLVAEIWGLLEVRGLRQFPRSALALMDFHPALIAEAARVVGRRARLREVLNAARTGQTRRMFPLSERALHSVVNHRGIGLPLTTGKAEAGCLPSVVEGM
jgi:hypothetical protein